MRAPNMTTLSLIDPERAPAAPAPASGVPKPPDTFAAAPADPAADEKPDTTAPDNSQDAPLGARVNFSEVGATAQTNAPGA